MQDNKPSSKHIVLNVMKIPGHEVTLFHFPAFAGVPVVPAAHVLVRAVSASEIGYFEG